MPEKRRQMQWGPTIGVVRLEQRSIIGERPLHVGGFASNACLKEIQARKNVSKIRRNLFLPIVLGQHEARLASLVPSSHKRRIITNCSLNRFQIALLH